MMDYEAFLGLARSRRSIRRFKPDPVPEEYITKVLEAARWAPSGANAQSWEFLVVKDPAIKAKIGEFHQQVQPLTRRMELTREEKMRHPAAFRSEGPELFLDAPVLIILLGDPRCKETYILTAYYGSAERNFYSELANAFLYMHLAARSLGVGSRWISTTYHPYMQALLKELLDIPRDYMVYDTMALGFPAGEPRPRTLRELASLVHYDRYDWSKHRSDAEVREFISTVLGERIKRPLAAPTP